MMAERVNTLVALDNGVDRSLVEAALPEGSDIQFVALVDGLEESWIALQDTAVDLVVVACAGYSDAALVFIDGAVKQRAERPVVVLCDSSPNGFVRRVFEAGADDLITLPESPGDVLFTLQKAVARKRGAAVATGGTLAPLVCVLGPKGGTGKTLTSCNLAVSLAEAGHRVTLVDLDLQFGDVGLALGLVPQHTIYDLAKAGAIDAEQIENFLIEHSSGVRVLMAPTRPDQAGTISVDFLRELYASLRTTNDFVVVDTPPGFTPEVIAAIDSSSHVCMVGMLDALSLKNTKLGLETLELMGYDSDRVRILLNRADSRVGIGHDEVKAIVGRAPDVLVPSDRDIPSAVNSGIPVVVANARSEAARAFRSLAEMYAQADAAQASTNGHKRRLLLRRKG
jgi:pilus assembly protein CpaE